jgi:adenylosuccinate lyase
VPFSGKFGGATGGLNAHVVAYPDIDWVVSETQISDYNLLHVHTPHALQLQAMQFH